MHESIGHLGIFVSGQVAKKEHAQIVEVLKYIEHLPPGLYGMQIEERRSGGMSPTTSTLTERRVEDLQALQKYDRSRREAVRGRRDGVWRTGIGL